MANQLEQGQIYANKEHILADKETIFVVLKPDRLLLFGYSPKK
jgi:hypothetical protein